MPLNFILIRHGESEANVINELLKSNTLKSVPDWYKLKPDWQIRLSEDGINQAKSAGEYLKTLDLDFKRSYCSPFLRTIETAAIVSQNTNQKLSFVCDDRFRERSWGTFKALDLDEARKVYSRSTINKSIDPFYWAPEGGESVSDAALRFRNILDTFHRELNGENVLAVTHGEFMWSVRFILERMLPSQWIELDLDKSNKIQNCMIFHYSRINPETKEISSSIQWLKAICPWDRSKDLFGGKWIRFDSKKELSADELLKIASQVPRSIN